MDGRLSFDVYAMLKDPHFRVDFQSDADRVEVVVGGRSICDEPRNTLNLWFSHPDTILDLARELMVAGSLFLEERERTARDLNSPDISECHPDCPTVCDKAGDGKREGDG